MGSKSERPKKRKIRLVGGGFRYSRAPNGVQGGSMKSRKRALRKLEKAKKKRGK